MAQIKKDSVRNRILECADRLFQEKGYLAATIGQIAREAEMTGSAIYVYFPSKLAIAIAVFEPRIIAKLDETEAAAAKIRNKRMRLAYILRSLWHDIPMEDNNYFNNLIQALVVSSDDNTYRPTILAELKSRVAALIRTCLTAERAAAFDVNAFAHLAVMAFDGFVINAHLNPHEVGRDDLIEAVCGMILGPRAQREP